MVKLLNGKGKIVELVGTVDSAPANDRYIGFREILKDYPDMVIIDSASGDFTAPWAKRLWKLSCKNMAQRLMHYTLIMMIWRPALSRLLKDMGSDPARMLRLFQLTPREALLGDD